MRATRKQLDNLVDYLNKIFPGWDFSVNRMVGIGYRLCRKNESIDVSPRLPLGKLIEWIHAFSAGYDSCKLQEKESSV